MKPHLAVFALLSLHQSLKPLISNLEVTKCESNVQEKTSEKKLNIFMTFLNKAKYISTCKKNVVRRFLHLFFFK